MGIAVWRVTIKPKIIHFLGHVSFRPPKKCAFQRGSEQKVVDGSTIAPASADRSGGPPKPGDSYEMGADEAAGWVWGAGEADGWPRGLAADPGGSADVPWSPDR